MFAGVVWLAIPRRAARRATPCGAANGRNGSRLRMAGNTVPYQGFKITSSPLRRTIAPMPLPQPLPRRNAAAQAPRQPLLRPAKARTPKAVAVARQKQTRSKTVAALIQQANSVPEPAKSPRGKPRAGHETAVTAARRNRHGARVL